MARFTPLPLPRRAEIATAPSDLERLVWLGRAVEADFFLDQTRRLRVSFPSVTVVRTIDDTYLSTKDDTPNEGQAEGRSFG